MEGFKFKEDFDQDIKALTKQVKGKKSDRKSYVRNNYIRLFIFLLVFLLIVRTCYNIDKNNIKKAR